MSTSYYGSNRITRTWVWRSDRVQSILNKTLDTLDDAFWAVDNESLEQEILEAIKIMKGFRDLILEDDFISDDIYPEDYIDGNPDYIYIDTDENETDDLFISFVDYEGKQIGLFEYDENEDGTIEKQCADFNNDGNPDECRKVG